LTSKTCKIEKISENISISIDGEEGYNDDVNIEFISEKLEIFKK
jgi:diacylglycerol kinase family enzyme